MTPRSGQADIGAITSREVAVTLERSGYRMRGAQLHIRGDVPFDRAELVGRDRSSHRLRPAGELRLRDRTAGTGPTLSTGRERVCRYSAAIELSSAKCCRPFAEPLRQLGIYTPELARRVNTQRPRDRMR